MSARQLQRYGEPKPPFKHARVCIANRRRELSHIKNRVGAYQHARQFWTPCKIVLTLDSALFFCRKIGTMHHSIDLGTVYQMSYCNMKSEQVDVVH